MNDWTPPTFSTYEELVSWAKRHHQRCACCGARTDEHLYVCQEHDDMWMKLVNTGESQGLAFEQWVNEHQPTYNTCADCGSTCPGDDYLCNNCRG